MSWPRWLHRKKKPKPLKQQRCMRCGFINEYTTKPYIYCQNCKQLLDINAPKKIAFQKPNSIERRNLNAVSGTGFGYKKEE